MEKPKWTDISIVILTGGILIAAILQTRIFDKQWKEMHDSGTDTHDLAVAAKAQADAARATADSTKDIADRALRQANATNDLAQETKRQVNIADKALKSSIESANQDRRPWVGLQLLQCNGCRVDADRSLIIGELSAVLINTGKTPALDMTVNYTFISTKASEPIPTYDAIGRDTEARQKRAQTIPAGLPSDIAADMAKTMELVNRRITRSKEVLAPNAARGITIIAGLRQARNMLARMEEENVVYGLGKVIYYDTSHAIKHTTTFCVMNDFGAAFRYCPNGNEMN